MGRIVSSLVFGIFCAALFNRAAAQEPLILAVHPYLAPTELVNRFTPLADQLARTVGVPINVRIGRSYAEHIDAIGSGSVDLAYIGPVAYVRLVAKHGKKPLLARQEVNGKASLRGMIFVRQDSPVRELAQLKGKRFAFGDPDSTMSYVVPKYLLQKAGVAETALGHRSFLGAHKNVVLAVLAGDYDAGAVKEEVFLEFSKKGIRALATTPPVADHVFVASAKLPTAMVKRLQHALLTLKDTEAGRAILNRVHPGTTALVPAQDTDYDNLRAMLAIHQP